MRTREQILRSTLEERFWAKVSMSGECWTWTAHVDEYSGYGRIAVNGTSKYAHRVSYELTHGEIPSGMQIDHICRTRPCVRPSHLRAVTNKQNHENLAPRSSNSSGYRGVTWYKSRNKWVVQVRHNDKRHSGGYFTRLDDAIAAAKALRNELFTHNDLDRISA